MATSGAPHTSGKPHAGARHIQRATGWGKRKYAGSVAESLWNRLDALDFMNQAMILAATLLLCAFPFFLVLTALTGVSSANVVAHRLGLSQQAAADVSHLIASSAATSAAVTGTAWVFFILAGIAVAGAARRYTCGFSICPRAAYETCPAR
jgi:membrane protein